MTDGPSHKVLGRPSRTWAYVQADGSPFCSVARWDPPGRRKEIRQFHVNGAGVEWARPEGLAPLYRLPELLRGGTRVLVVGGEKTADAAQRLFPGWGVTTNLGGENAETKTDWSGVRSKRVTIWPDADDTGYRWSERVARLCLQAGATSVHVVDVPLSAPEGWDLADPIPDGWRVDELLESAVEYRSDAFRYSGDGAADVEPEPEPELWPEGLNYPAELWEARPWLSQLRRHALAREIDPDMLLGACLARFSALLPKGTAMDTGILNKRASLNLLVAGIGGSGGGKSSAADEAATIIPVPVDMEKLFVEGVLGSGQGIADAYMGKVCVNPDAPAKERKFEYAQRLHNAFLWLDEGQTLGTLAAMKGNSTLATLRSAAMGAMLGSQNADPERRRKVTNYHFGCYIGWQPATVGMLLDEVLLGTPQRFLFCAMGPVIEGEADGWAAPLLERPPCHMPVIFADDLRAEIRARHIEQKRRARRLSTEPDWHSHAGLLRCKVAALLCLVDHRQLVTSDDWRLAGIICETSHAIVQWLRSERARQHEAEELGRIALRSAAAAASAIAVAQAPEEVTRLARSLANKVHERGRTSKSDARRTLWEPKRPLFDAACTEAAGHGWLLLEENHVAPGPNQP